MANNDATANDEQEDHRRGVARWLERCDGRVEDAHVGDRARFGQLREFEAAPEVAVEARGEIALSREGLLFDGSLREWREAQVRRRRSGARAPFPCAAADRTIAA